MEIYVGLGVIIGWLVLQFFVLPKLGFSSWLTGHCASRAEADDDFSEEHLSDEMWEEDSEKIDEIEV